MGRTNYKHGLITLGILVALALYGMVFVEFVFVCAVCIGTTFVVGSLALGFFCTC